MSRKIETTVYMYDELSDDAKENARDWYRSHTGADDSYFITETTIEEFKETLTALGFVVDAQPGMRTRAAIYWNTNPIEASFGAHWSAKNYSAELAAKLLTNRPLDKGIERAVRLMAAFVDTYPQAWASTDTGRRCNKLTIAEFDTGADTDVIYDTSPIRASDELLDICTDIAGELASAIDRDITYANSVEAIAENIVANGYEFTESGECFEG